MEEHARETKASAEVLVRREILEAMFDSIAERRRHIASCMGSPGDISGLSRNCLLDMLSILAFDRNVTQRLIMKEFYGGGDERARAMEKAVTDRLQREFRCDNGDIHRAIGRGCGLMYGDLSAQEVWQDTAFSDPAR